MKKGINELLIASELFCQNHKVEIHIDKQNQRTGHGPIFIDNKRVLKKDLGKLVFYWYESNYGFGKKWATIQKDIIQWVLHYSTKINNTQL